MKRMTVAARGSFVGVVMLAAAQGQGVEGVAQMREGVAARRVMGHEVQKPYFLALLTEGYRLKGELLLMQAGTGHEVQEAETCLRQALAVARRQQAKWLELRATISLSRLWQQQGKCAAARHLLAEIYGWFTEGFETPDLREAQALLTELT